MKAILPFPPSKLNPNRSKGNHWGSTSRLAKQYRADCHTAAIAAGWRGLDVRGFDVLVAFHPPTNRKRDKDNLIAAFKHGQDGLCAAWGVDDSTLNDRISHVIREARRGGDVEIILTRSECDV